MKKFLSLVLAMIMTLSLVTISAGATEYKDLTDKDEIKYEEAVAVLNRIGVITGYEDGTFRPETELTRGAAAKIIVSLMIGPDAAGALSNNTSPYPDVPAGHTFAGVISYCKTAGYISGYGDGNFKPAGTLTGYAFSKMLLGALGYKSDIEGFVDTGWTNNVARIGNVSGLFDRISFDGAAAVNRDQACQLALNTLKATMVRYETTTAVGPNGTYTLQGEAIPVTSNNRDINANIGRKDWYGGNNKGSDYLTLEFGEEHFKDLRLEHDRFDPAHDDFGRPSNEWSYKKVTIGTFPLEADFTYTTQVAHREDTDGVKEKALGLRNYDLIADGGYSVWSGWGNTGTVTAINGGVTNLWLNGLEKDEFFAETRDGKYVNKVSAIADYTDNGTLVEVYVSDVDADWITDVVVIQTQLMEVKKVGSDYVSLERVDPDALENGTPRGEPNIGFNLAPIEVNIEQVKDNNEDCYNVLKGLKSGDEVAIVPVTTDNGKTYEAAEAYVPETVSGALTRVDTYGIGKDSDKERGAVSITVGGTAYKLADWNKEMWDLKTEAIKATRKDVTLLMDKYGNALLAKDVGATNDFMVIGNFYQALAGSKICTFVHGWDISGNELDLNLGSSLKIQTHNGRQSVENHVLGELVYYTSEGASGDADYVLRHVSSDGKKFVRDVYTNLKNTGDDTKFADVDATYEIKASNLLLPVVTSLTGNDYQLQLEGKKKDLDNHFGESSAHYGRTNNDATGSGNGLATHDDTYASTNYINRYYDKGVKFIYVNYVAGDDEIESIEVKSGAQNVSQEELRQAIMFWPSQAAVKDDLVKAVVIKRESNDANINRMLYVTKTLGFKEYDKDSNESFYEVEVAMFTSDGKFVTEQHIIINKDLQIGDFATYTKVAGTKYEDNYYRVKLFNRHNANPAVLRTTDVSKVFSTVDNKMVKQLMRLNNAYDLATASKLDPDAKNDGIGATSGESYVLGGYRGSSTTVPNSIVDATGVIRADKAEWLNATRNSKYDDIDSIEDLFKIVGNDKLDRLSDLTLHILLNEKPDADGFRSAYLVVISKVNNDEPVYIDDPLNTGFAINTVYSTSWDKTMVKGDKFSVTLAKDYKVDLSKIKGAIVIDHSVDESYWVFEKTTGTVEIPLIYTGAPVEKTYDVTITLDSKTVISETKAAGTYTYQIEVPAGKTVTYEGKTYAAGEKVPVKVTVVDKAVTVALVTKDAETPDVGSLPKVVICESAKGAVAEADVAFTKDGAAADKLAVGDKYAITGVPDSDLETAYRAVVYIDGKKQEQTSEYTYAENTVIYIQKGTVDYDIDLSTGLFLPMESYDETELPEDLSARSVQNATLPDGRELKWVNGHKGFVSFKIGSKTYVVELVDVRINGKLVANALRVRLVDSAEILEAVKAGSKPVYDKDTKPENGFVNIPGNTEKDIPIPLVDGKAPVILEDDEDTGATTIKKDPDATVEVKVNGKPITEEGAKVDADTQVELGDPIVPPAKVLLTITKDEGVESVTVNGTPYTEPVQVDEDSEVTLVISPLADYEISTVKVNGVARTPEKDGTVKFTANQAENTVEIAAEQKNDLPFKIKETTANVCGKKISDLQSNFKWTVDSTGAKKVIKLSGDLNFVQLSDDNGVFGDPAHEKGWYVDFTIDQSANKEVSKIEFMSLVSGAYRTATSKDGDVYEPNGSTDGTATDSNDLVIFIASEKKLSEKAYLRVTYKDQTTEVIDIDLTGLKLLAPVILSVGAAKTADTDFILDGNADTDKKIPEIQKGFSAELNEAGDTLFLKGTLLPVFGWTAWGSNTPKNDQQGYFCIFNVDAGGSDYTVKLFNTQSSLGDGGRTLTGKNDLCLKIADIEADEPTAGAQYIQATKAGESPVFIKIDTSGLTLDTSSVGGITVEEYTKAYDETTWGKKQPSDFQSGIKITPNGDTFVFEGELTATEWSKGWGAANKGYYVAFDVDVTSVVGATKFKVTGESEASPAQTTKTHDDIIWRLGNEDMKQSNMEGKTAKLEVQADSTVKKTYTLDFSGLTLKKVDPFTVKSETTTPVTGVAASDLQRNFTVDVDHDAKEIIVTGTLLPIDKIGTSVDNLKSIMTDFMGTGNDTGYFISFDIMKGVAGAPTRVKTSGATGAYGGTGTFTDYSNTGERVVIRVAELGENPTAKAVVDLKFGEEWVSYKVDFTGVTLQAQ